MPFQLVGSDGRQQFELRSGAALVIGRALSCDIPVLDPTVSRRHAEIVAGDDGAHLRDLASSNGTFVNGTKVTDSRIAAGDVVTFGKVAFRLREVAEGAERRPSAAVAQHDESGEESAAAPSSAPVGLPARRSGGSTVFRPIPPQLRPGSSGGALGITGAGVLLAPALDADLARNQQKLALLLEVSKGLGRFADVDALLDKIAAFTFEILDADLVAVLLTDDAGELHPKIARDRRGDAVAARAVPQSIVRTAVAEKVAILSDDAPADQRFGGDSVVMQRVRSMMCAPLVGSEDRVLGVLYVDHLTATHRFSEDDLTFLVAFAGIAGVAIENGQFAERIRRETIVRSNFERYFAPSLAERIAAEPGAAQLGGEKRTVAVLFSDIRGFTALSETMRPDDMASLLSEYFTEMVECVFRHGGTLDKFIGDAVMAQWGAPIGARDDGDRAVRAAIDMMRALSRLNAIWRAEGRPTLEIGIGLNFGEAFAGNIGSERRLEFTVIGDTVNVASRLCACATSGEILLTEAMRDALIDPPPLAEHDPVELRGKALRLAVYAVRHDAIDGPNAHTGDGRA